MKVAIYARYSSENQRDASIADQFRICREFAERQGWKIEREYSDHAISGATLLRPGFQAMCLCFGYRVVRRFENGAVTTGEREINEGEASVVRQIFDDYAAGASPKQIAKTLNKEGIPGP